MNLRIGVVGRRAFGFEIEELQVSSLQANREHPPKNMKLPYSKNEMKSIRPTFISLFSGCGGLDLGFINAGFRCIGAFDNDTLAVSVHKRNIGSAAVCHDLSSGIPRQFASARVDVLVAGPPCQGFSTAGPNDPADARNSLFRIPVQAAEVYAPRVVVIENVMGITATKNCHHVQSHIRAMRSLGYLTAEVHCNATSHGVPQERRRVILLAWRATREVTIRFPERQGGTLSQVLEGLTGCTHHHPRFLKEGTPLGAIARSIKPGQKLSNVRGGARSVHTWDIPIAFGFTTAEERKVLRAIMLLRRRGRRRDHGDADPVAARLVSREVGFPVASLLGSLQRKGFVRQISGRYDLVHTFNGKFRRLSMDKPSPTVHTRFGDPRYFLHPFENRGFTVREAARIQTFPDSFQFEGNADQQYRMIGNAVPPVLAAVVATFVRDAFLSN